MKIESKVIYGWGINDVPYHVNVVQYVKGERKILWTCPYYMDWKSMIQRCHSEKYQQNKPTYIGCTICEEWKHLSNFIKWVDSQPNRNWQNCSLDKDFLVEGNKHYSPETCVYIPRTLNSFTVRSEKFKGDYMLGVSISDSIKSPYQVKCSNPFSNKNQYLGIFETELEAHKAWQVKKHEHALRLADEQSDPRVAKVLRERYAPDKDWTNT